MKNSALILLALVLIGLAGCATASPIDPSDLSPQLPPISVDSPSRAFAAVVWGLTNVDASAYGGWSGACPGCDVDAKRDYNELMPRGIPVELLLNFGATKSAAQAAIAKQASGLASGDELLIFYSSHGALVDDVDGDEKDGTGQDSALVMYDGLWVDDDFLAFLESVVPDGVRVRIFSDCCHSEGNFRGYVRSFQQAVSFGSWGKLPRFELRTKKKLSFSITQLAGCKKLKYSYGADDGGVWTTTFWDSQNGTWKASFDDAAKKMPSDQTPAWVEDGPMSDEIRNAPMFP